MAVAIIAAGRCMVTAAASPEPEASYDSWSFTDSPYGPGVWLTGPADGDVAHAFVPPGAKASPDESDQERRGWRHLTIDDDLSIPTTITKLDTHEVYTMVPRGRRGWVMEQSIRHSDGSVRGADLLETLASMGVEPDLLDRGLQALGRKDNLSLYWAAVRATHAAVEVRHAAEAAVADTMSFAAETLSFGTQRDDRYSGSVT